MAHTASYFPSRELKASFEPVLHNFGAVQLLYPGTKHVPVDHVTISRSPPITSSQVPQLLVDREYTFFSRQADVGRAG